MSFHLERVGVDGVRNLSAQQLELNACANIVAGVNGSGKTSLLEALHMLSTGRSFRTASAKPLIAHGADWCLVTGQLRSRSRAMSLGIRRHRNGAADISINREKMKSVASLAAALPTVVLEPNSVELVTGAPDGRRRFIDGTMFHVEHDLLRVWQGYYRVLRQRNSGLRRGILATDGAWRAELAEYGCQLSEMRARWVTVLGGYTRALLQTLSPELADVTVSLRQGWDTTCSLSEALIKSVSSDVKQGFTHVGPHRGDLRLQVDGRPVSDVFSRGQVKLVVVALKLAQGQVMKEALGSGPVYLVDDLVSELDGYHAGHVCEVLAAGGSQIVLTSVDADQAAGLWPSSKMTLFHVEQGNITAR